MKSSSKFTNFKFSNIEIHSNQIFFQRKYCVAFVNIKPCQPGHVLLCPTRIVSKYHELTDLEVMEIWAAAKQISNNLKKFYKTEYVSFTIQNGENSGKSVDHCHIHIVPYSKTFINNQKDVLPKLCEKFDKEMFTNQSENEYKTINLSEYILESDKIPKRNLDEMANEASSYVKNFTFL